MYEVDAEQIVRLSAKGDADRVEVQSRVGGRAAGAHEVGGSAAVTATDLQHPFVPQVDLGRDAVVELNVVTVRLVRFR